MSTVEKYCKGGLVMPDWVSVEDTIPTEDGGYYAVVEYLKDTEDLLDEKDAPVDRGVEVFLKLYDTRVTLR